MENGRSPGLNKISAEMLKLAGSNAEDLANCKSFADDIVLISNDPRKLQQRLRKLKVVSEEIGLTINTEKAKVVTADEQEFRLDDNVMKKANSYIYIYLDHTITLRKGNQTIEVKR
ncbi:hypothetical protein ILUMI_19546 [Ignelater luminosus]|uniref:Reverse transcriptase domain-containing protein n=1 Tax=Ignelater luminosus TaxID=2038154 RepID=A0A8K0CM74_IGNLU|nr:hypothetical protein ILUMI_19546 [Ignelater luminosus]